MSGLLVALTGLPGSGKSTLARATAARLGALWLRIDTIEDAMRARGFDFAGSNGDAGYRVAQAVARDNLALGRIVIADSVNPIALTRTAWEDTARTAGAPCLTVEVTCADPVLHRARVEARRATDATLPDWTAVAARPWEPVPAPDLRLDTARLTADAAADALATLVRTRIRRA